MARLRTPEVEDLLTVLAGLHQPDEVFALLEDLFTVREIKDISQRFEVACMLREGKSYAAIEQTTGASATTIARVSKALNYGAGGYAKAFSVLDQASADKAAPEGYDMVCDGNSCRLVPREEASCAASGAGLVGGQEEGAPASSNAHDALASSGAPGLVEA